MMFDMFNPYRREWNNSLQSRQSAVEPVEDHTEARQQLNVAASRIKSTTGALKKLRLDIEQFRKDIKVS